MLCQERQKKAYKALQRRCYEAATMLCQKMVTGTLLMGNTDLAELCCAMLWCAMLYSC